MDDAVHRSLLEALGEPESLAALGSAVWFPGDQWAAALQRARRARFPELSEEDGLFRIGEALGGAFLEKGAGRMLAEALPVLSLDRVFGVLTPALMDRLRSRFEVRWVPAEGGGSLHIEGPVSLPPAVTAGFFERVLHEVNPRARVTVGPAAEQRMELVVRVGA